MKYADLHIHSSYSDGCKTTEEIIDSAIKNKIKYISITDHDSISSQYVTRNSYDDLVIIPGIELSTEYNDMELHILGYFKDNRYEGEEFKKMLNSMKKGKFKECQIYHKGKLSFKSEGGKISTSAGVEFLHHYGAFVVLAHPTLLKREAFNELINLNFDGIEAKYYRNKENETEYFISMAKEKGIIYTAGSDFHSLRKVDLKHGTLGQIFLEEDEIKVFLDKLYEKGV